MHPIQKEKMHNPCILCLRLLHRNRFFSSFAYKPKQQLFYQKGSKDAERGVFYNWVLYVTIIRNGYADSLFIKQPLLEVGHSSSKEI
jgi:hypothetical protein